MDLKSMASWDEFAAVIDIHQPRQYSLEAATAKQLTMNELITITLAHYGIHEHFSIVIFKQAI